MNEKASEQHFAYPLLEMVEKPYSKPYIQVRMAMEYMYIYYTLESYYLNFRIFGRT